MNDKEVYCIKCKKIFHNDDIVILNFYNEECCNNCNPLVRLREVKNARTDKY